MRANVELYNLIRNGRAVGNGWLVRVQSPGRTEFKKFEADEQAARTYAANVNAGVES